MARLGKRGQGMLQAQGTAARVCVMGRACLPVFPPSTLHCYLGTCYGQGQLLGGTQCAPRHAVDPEQLMLGRKGAMPGELEGAVRPSGTCSGVEEADLTFLLILPKTLCPPKLARWLRVGVTPLVECLPHCASLPRLHPQH